MSHFDKLRIDLLHLTDNVPSRLNVNIAFVVTQRRKISVNIYLVSYTVVCIIINLDWFYCNCC